MTLRCVTLTGADDSVSVEELKRLAKAFPFVEFGILFSASQQGGPRYPSYAWLSQLMDSQLPLAAHLCGQYARHLVMHGNTTWWYRFSANLTNQFYRVQLNWRGYQEVAPDFESVCEHLPHLFILQCDGINDIPARRIYGRGKINGTNQFMPLFDRSGGTGILPDRWPQAWADTYCGYAGGLSPTNIVDQLALIRIAARKQPFWIDMERHLRSEDNRLFDLQKCQAVLEATAPYVEGQ